MSPETQPTGEHARRERPFRAPRRRRATGARAARGQECCLSAQEIHDRLRAGDGRAVGLASVYRAVDVLTQLRLVHRVDVDGTACYEPADPSGEHHHHAICERCGKRDAFEDAELERLIDGVARGSATPSGRTTWCCAGRCPDCAPRAV